MNDLIKKIEELQNRIVELENRKPDYSVQEFLKDSIIEKSDIAKAQTTTNYDLTGEGQTLPVIAPTQHNGTLVIVWKGTRFKIPYYNN